ncbi:tubulin-specific chaperone A isoform X2 [Chlorocebus sabaeus]|uniref:tubulin-specific chaperone A isoform X2 n=1 Tax=Chlorocebus sabaeus TaxID=60711 RepID=UPI003BFA16A0
MRRVAGHAHIATASARRPPRLPRFFAPPSRCALGTMAEPRVRQIKIKTGVVKRLVKEKVMYEKEAKQQEEKIEKMRAEDGENYDIKKQISQEIPKEIQRGFVHPSSYLPQCRDPTRIPDDDPRLPAQVGSRIFGSSTDIRM